MGTLLTIRQLEIAVAVEQGKLLDATEAALEDDHVTATELKKITAAGTEVVRMVETLKSAVKREAGS